MVNILVVEDQKSMLNLIQESLEIEGYRVLTAANVPDASKILDAEPIDVLMTDLNLPERSGIELVVKSSNEYENVYIIVVTGGDIAGNEYIEEARVLGAHKAFKKPFDMNELKKAIEEGLAETRVADGI